MSGESLTVAGGRVTFGGAPGLEDIRFSVSSGERVALLGPSGSGKTSLLRALAGLGEWAGGTIQVGQKDVSREPPERRGVVYMHQAPSLFPHLAVIDNVAFPLRIRGMAAGTARQRAQHVLSRVRLGALAMRMPGTLSGGQRHRVALARAVAASPAVLLLDEPFASLDPVLRAEVRSAVLELLVERHGPAVVLVTHDIDEAALLADRILVLLNGRIAQDGPAAEVLAAPRSLDVARFLGLPNILHGFREPGGEVWCPLGAVHSPGPEGPVAVVIRPSGICAGPPGTGGIPGKVTAVVERVSGRDLRVCFGSESVVASQAFAFDAPLGAEVVLSLDPSSIHVIDDPF